MAEAFWNGIEKRNRASSALIVHPPANHLRKYLVTPATNYETGEPIVFDDAMIEAFENLEPGPPIQDRIILIGLNDDVIHPSTQRAFCERFGWEYITVPWGHRVGDASRLLKEIGGIPALHADIRKVARVRAQDLEVFARRARREARETKMWQDEINRAEEAITRNRERLAQAQNRKENRTNPSPEEVARDEQRIRHHQNGIENWQERLQEARIRSKGHVNASSRSVSTDETSAEPRITWRGADVMVSTLPLPDYQGSHTVVVSAQARKINIAMRALAKLRLYSVNYVSKYEFYGRIAEALNTLSELDRADDEIAVTTVFDTALEVLQDWMDTLKVERPKPLLY